MAHAQFAQANSKQLELCGQLDPATRGLTVAEVRARFVATELGFGLSPGAT